MDTAVETLKQNKYLGFACVADGDEPDFEIEAAEEESKPLTKEASIYERLQDLQESVKDKRKEDQLDIQSFQEFEKHIYDELGFFKLLSMIDYMIGLTESAPKLLAHIQRLFLPEQLQNIMRLVVESHPRTQQLALRILQTLLKFDLPQEVYNQAVTLASKRQLDVTYPGACLNLIQKHLEM